MMLKSFIHLVGTVVIALGIVLGVAILTHRYHDTIGIGMRTLTSWVERNFERV